MPTDNVVAIYPTDSALNLQGNWTDFSLQNPQGNDQTVVFASSSASGSVKFNGTQVAVYGVVPAGESVQSFYSVDGSSPAYYVSPGNATTPQWGTVFYVSPQLNSGTHELTFNVTNATVESIYTLEFVLYEGQGGQGSQTSLPTTVGGAATGSAAAPTSGTTSVNVGAIVGGVVGGVAGLIILSLLIFFGLRRRNRRPYYYAESGDLLREEVKARPFTQGAPLVPDGGVPYRENVQASNYSVTVSSERTPLRQPTLPSEVGESAHSSSAGSSSTRPTLTVVGGPPGIKTSPNMAQSKAAEAGLLSVESQPTYHADSGVRFDSHGQPVASGSGSGSAGPSQEYHGRTPTDVPPLYSEN